MVREKSCINGAPALSRCSTALQQGSSGRDSAPPKAMRAVPARPRPRPGPRRQHARPVRCEHPAGMLQPPKGTKELTGAKILACLRALPLSRSGFAMPAPGSLLSRETGGVAASELEMMAGVICACQARAATARAGSTVPISNWSCSPRGGTLLLHRRPLAQKLKDVHASV
jgi:hypothetical protein